jgi:hypothetical protein
MSKLHYGELVSESIAWTKQVLFKPFHWKKWLILIIFMILSNNLIMCSLDLNIPGGGDKKEVEVTSETATSTPVEQEINSAQQASDVASSVNEAAHSSFWLKVADLFTGKYVSLIISGFVLSVVLVIALLVFFTWLVARFEFIWYRAIIKNESKLRQPFCETRVIGNSLFKTYLVLGISVIVLFLLSVALGLSLAWNMGMFQAGFEWTFMKVFSVVIWPVLMGLGLFVVSILIALILYDFIVPMMDQKQIKCMPACREWLGIFRLHWKKILIFYLLRVALFVVSFGLLLVLTILLMVVFVLVAAAIIGIPFLIVYLLMKIKVVFWIIAVLLGAPLLAGYILLNLAASLPFAVFLRVFGIRFLHKLDVGYAVDLVGLGKQKTDLESAKQLKPVLESAGVVKPKPKPKTASKPKSTPKPKIASKPKVAPKPKSASKPKATPKPKVAAKPKIKPKAATKRRAKPKR